MNSLGLKRVFFLGDSLTYQHAQSLWGFLTKHELINQPPMPVTPGGKIDSSYLIGFNGLSFDCSDILGTEFTISLEFVRNDDLSLIEEWEFDLLALERYVDAGKSANARGRRHPWLMRYANNPDATLLIANTGMHTPDLEHYKTYFPRFVEVMELLSRPLDLVVYRTSVPGHGSCRSDTIPLENAIEWSQLPAMYQWDQVAEFNQYTKQALSDLFHERGRDDWMLLDVFPMTVLRQDGHLAPPTDCLHYKLPGPVDYWLHLLYSNLLDLQRARS